MYMYILTCKVIEMVNIEHLRLPPNSTNTYGAILRKSQSKTL